MTQGSNMTTTDYLDTSTSLSTSGFQSEDGQLEFILQAEGFVSYAQIPELQEVNKFSYVYNYTDHTSARLSTSLGNIKLSYTEDPHNDNQLIILEENNYYPFGLLHGGYNKDVKKIDFCEYADMTQQQIIAAANELIDVYPVIKGDYDYKYQGQERQDELNLNWDSFKWRNNACPVAQLYGDYAVGRFMSVDPITEKYEYMTPYQFDSNNLVWKIELEGLEGVIYQEVDKNNKVIRNVIQLKIAVVTVD